MFLSHQKFCGKFVYIFVFNKTLTYICDIMNKQEMGTENEREGLEKEMELAQ